MLDSQDYADKNFQDFIELEYVLTPIPEKLTISWHNDGSGYSFDNVFDGSSLIWISVMQDTFNEMYPEYDWTVDDPGTLYTDDENIDDAGDSPYDLGRLQEITNITLDRYAYVFEKLEEAGVPVVSDKEGY